ncbi:exodeoxyribonuclease VII small subunit [Candidatus Neptunochlamydia vexilliferae]|uniref:exodeoxyribonuclease VII small subunit n=1 Tax=Candidatus Neptunichlamydia vexilliferae TaxID=1651774 RepID=UPI001E584BD8|nr:exodeoxyribonuclease VII small subunit [Candidatus Neptunochlamydia vexilliferae]
MEFEKAYERLEQILGELNSGETPLEKSLALYEEANKLITLCSSKLSQAEQKIETLIKGRGETPQTAPFAAANDTYP